MKANIHIPFAIIMWIAFGMVLVRGFRNRRQLDRSSLYGWIQIFCAACVFSLQGEYVELWLDRYFGGLPVTLYIKYFAMVVWFGMYYLIIKQIFPGNVRYRWLDWWFPIALVVGTVSIVPVAMMPYGARTAGRDLVTGLRDGFLFIPAVLLFVSATWKLAQQEKVNGMRVKQLAITLCYAAYSVVAFTNAAKALLIAMHQEPTAQLDIVLALFMSICLVGFVLVLLPYRWLTVFFYPSRLRLYWRLKRVEDKILRQVGAVSDTPLFAPFLLRSSELELAIYRTTINILDYGTLLPKAAYEPEQSHELQDLAESNLPYSELVSQLTKVEI